MRREDHQRLLCFFGGGWSGSGLRSKLKPNSFRKIFSEYIVKNVKNQSKFNLFDFKDFECIVLDSKIATLKYFASFSFFVLLQPCTDSGSCSRWSCLCGCGDCGYLLLQQSLQKMRLQKINSKLFLLFVRPLRRVRRILNPTFSQLNINGLP